mgnify:CR=1 FL=1
MCVRLVVADLVVVFFFQAEDGIRDYDVTGVQTCALPIFDPRRSESAGVHTNSSQLPVSCAGMLILQLNRVRIIRSIVCARRKRLSAAHAQRFALQTTSGKQQTNGNSAADVHRAPCIEHMGRGHMATQRSSGGWAGTAIAFSR